MRDTSTRGETSDSTPVVVTVQFQPAGRPYNFSASSNMDLEADNWVIVETVYGTQVGQVVSVNSERTSEHSAKNLKPVLRRATGLDMARHQMLEKRAKRLVEVAQEELNDLGIKGVKVVSAEYTLDGDRAVVFLSGGVPGKQRSGFRRRLSSRMHTRVNLRPVGPRDQAKLLGGYGVCGEPRCCSRFLTQFRSVSIRMAKDQSVSMAPTDITGMCGRLRCCLTYEHQVYKEAAEGFPKRKSRVRTPEGVGRVIDWDVLNGEIVVEVPPYGPRRDREKHRFPVEEVEVIPQKK
ncbi:MAG: PSP1 domain-containing protein [Anaerolineae bacterium]